MSGKTTVDLTDIKTGCKFHFETMASACNFLNRQKNYITNCANFKRAFAYNDPRPGEIAKAFTYKITKHKVVEKVERTIQLCSYCGHCNRVECVFIASGGNLPVPGWAADPSVVKVGNRADDSWSIKRCPNFTADIAIIKGTAEMRPIDWKTLKPYASEIAQQKLEWSLTHESE